MLPAYPLSAEDSVIFAIAAPYRMGKLVEAVAAVAEVVLGARVGPKDGRVTSGNASKSLRIYVGARMIMGPGCGAMPLSDDIVLRRARKERMRGKEKREDEKAEEEGRGEATEEETGE